MPFYKDLAKNDELHWLDDVKHEEMLPSTCVLITDEEAEEIRARPKIRQVMRVSARQIRMALSQVGLRDDVEAAVAAGSRDLQDWYEFTRIFERDHPQVVAMAALLGVTDTQLDDLWNLAITL